MSENDNRTQTFDESELPDWAIHEEDQESLNAFFNEPADRGKSETAFAIPRGESDPVELVSGASATIISPAPEAAEEVDSLPDGAMLETPVEEAVPATGPAFESSEAVAEAAPESAPAAEAAPDAAAEATVETAEPAVAEVPEATAVVDEVPAETSEDQIAQEEAQEAVGEPSAQDVQAETDDAQEDNVGNAGAPRREDFARFRCIYESQDGQLALYEDEEGHLTAVNTNRFV